MNTPLHSKTILTIEYFDRHHLIAPRCPLPPLIVLFATRSPRLMSSAPFLLFPPPIALYCLHPSPLHPSPCQFLPRMFDGWWRSLQLLRAQSPPKLFNSPTCCEPCHLLGQLSLHCRTWCCHRTQLRLTRIARAQRADPMTRTRKIPVDNDGHVSCYSPSLHHRHVLCQHCRHCTAALLPTMPSLH